MLLPISDLLIADIVDEIVAMNFLTAYIRSPKVPYPILELLSRLSQAQYLSMAKAGGNLRPIHSASKHIAHSIDSEVDTYIYVMYNLI